MKKGVKGFGQEEAGVTLIELLVVLAIIGILVLVGVNMMGGVVSKQRLRSAAEEFHTSLRAAQMLAIVNNRPVTVVVSTTGGSYYACLDSAPLKDCTNAGDQYLNLDSGKTSTGLSLVEKKLHPLVSIYNATFGYVGTAGLKAVTFMPPSGLPSQITNATTGALVNGAACFMVETGEGSAYKDKYDFRKVSVDAVVGKPTMWRNLKEVGGVDITAKPYCNSQVESGATAEWEKVY